ncbi:hypothetical protein SCUCBS95973_007774 [Sporothrix curviconia]|uniref:Uncharacterized protein n=1 Tax=Sporothrix curviconia TaxID=1260050 RepID=A0ABP0CHZ5_9PEZI
MLRSIWASRAPLASWLPRRSLTSGLSASAASAATTAPPFVQHVRIKARRRWRNVAIGASVMYVCWSAYFSRVVVPPLADHIEDDGEPIFVPFPFTFKVVESRPYKGTDPEWQTYIRIAKDRELLMKIRNDMLETVRTAAEANPILTMRCGKQMKVRKHWLDLDFPYRPPPKITRNGLMLTAEGLDYVEAEVDPVTMMRISRALWPEPVALSASSFVTTLFRQNMHNVARFFGFEPAENGPLGATGSSMAGHNRPPQDLHALAAELKRRLEEAEAKDTRARPGKKEVGVQTDMTGSLSPSPAPTPASSPRDKDDPSRILNAKDLIPFESLRASIDDAWIEFKKKLAETWLPLRPQPPGGSVGVSGLVELQSPNSRIMIEVMAFWDPKTRKYDAPSLHMKLRSIRPRTQMPL